MARLSTTVTILVITLVAFSFFAGVSFAFSPVDDGSFAGPGAFGFTVTPGSSGASAQSTGGGPPSIPEPTTVILTGLGIAGLAGYAARKKRGASDDTPDSTQE